jgi:hypothetical protein
MFIRVANATIPEKNKFKEELSVLVIRFVNSIRTDNKKTKIDDIIKVDNIIPLNE